jgi:hypothetical protein
MRWQSFNTNFKFKQLVDTSGTACRQGQGDRRDHLTMDISDDEKGRIIPLWIVNYLIGYTYPDDILLVGTIRLSKCI